MNYNDAVEAMFNSPYGSTALSELDRLQEAEREQFLMWASLGLGSGVPVFKFLSPRFLRELAEAAARLAPQIRR